MSYCEKADLLVGDIVVGPGNSFERWITTAGLEMDSKMGYIYVTPIDVTILPPHQSALLKMICAKLASGRMLMAMAQGGEDTSVHAYALLLVRQATEELMLIANGEVDLTAPRVDEDGAPVDTVDDPTVDDPYARIPTGSWADDFAATTVFEHNYFGGGVTPPDPWVPSDNVPRRPPFVP